MDKVRKVYVDSRFRTKDSVSNSGFKIELKEAIDLPENTVCYVDDISIPHSWHTVENGRNNTLYIVTTHIETGPPSTWWHTLALDIAGGNYNGVTLAAALQKELLSLWRCRQRHRLELSNQFECLSRVTFRQGQIKPGVLPGFRCIVICLELELELTITRMIQNQGPGPACVARKSKARPSPSAGGWLNNKKEGKAVGAGTRRGVRCGWPFGRSARCRPPALLARPPLKFLTRELLGRWGA